MGSSTWGGLLTPGCPRRATTRSCVRGVHTTAALARTPSGALACTHSPDAWQSRGLAGPAKAGSAREQRKGRSGSLRQVCMHTSMLATRWPDCEGVVLEACAHKHVPWVLIHVRLPACLPTCPPVGLPATPAQDSLVHPTYAHMMRRISACALGPFAHWCLPACLPACMFTCLPACPQPMHKTHQYIQDARRGCTRIKGQAQRPCCPRGQLQPRWRELRAQHTCTRQDQRTQTWVDFTSRSGAKNGVGAPHAWAQGRRCCKIPLTSLLPCT